MKHCEGDSAVGWLSKPQASAALAPGGATLCQTPSLGTADCSVLSLHQDIHSGRGGGQCTRPVMPGVAGPLCYSVRSGRRDSMRSKDAPVGSCWTSPPPSHSPRLITQASWCPGPGRGLVRGNGGHLEVWPWSLGKQPQGSKPGMVALIGPAKGTPRTTYGWAHQCLCFSSRPPFMQLNVTVCACVCKGEGCREDAALPSQGSGHTGNTGPGVCGPRPDRVEALAPFFPLAQHTAFLLGR